MKRRRPPFWVLLPIYLVVIYVFVFVLGGRAHRRRMETMHAGRVQKRVAFHVAVRVGLAGIPYSQGPLATIPWLDDDFPAIEVPVPLPPDPIRVPPSTQS
jgi:hypothetical protein